MIEVDDAVDGMERYLEDKQRALLSKWKCNIVLGDYFSWRLGVHCNRDDYFEG